MNIYSLLVEAALFVHDVTWTRLLAARQLLIVPSRVCSECVKSLSTPSEGAGCPHFRDVDEMKREKLQDGRKVVKSPPSVGSSGSKQIEKPKNRSKSQNRIRNASLSACKSLLGRGAWVAGLLTTLMNLKYRQMMINYKMI